MERWKISRRPRRQSGQEKSPRDPFLLVAQPSLFDDSRAPNGKHTVWAYTHVPPDSTFDATDRIEAQIERFAPGFRDRILAKHVMNPAALQAYNANYIGGDINGGVQDFRQTFARPMLRWNPYSTTGKGTVFMLRVHAAGRRRSRHVWLPRGPVGAARRVLNDRPSRGRELYAALS